eukprot:gene53951-59528_t
MPLPAVVLLSFAATAADGNHCGGARPAPADATDLSRARARTVSLPYQGDGAADVRKVLNRHLSASLPRPVPCEGFDVGALHDLQRELHCRRDERLVA